MNILLVLTILTTIALAVVSVFGAFVPSTYGKETASLAAQGIGQDLFNLVVVAPLLVIFLFLMKKGSKTSIFLYGGLLFYVLYSFIIYSLGIHFNQMFLLYCLILGLSTYAFIVFFYGLDMKAVKSWFAEPVPVYAGGIFLIIIAVLFGFIWMKDILPALLNDTVPPSVAEYGLLVNPVHVIDLSFALPGLIISAVLLMKKHSLGYVLAPVGLAFTVFMALALVAMAVMLKLKGISDDISLVYIFLVIALISIGFLTGFYRKLNK